MATIHVSRSGATLGTFEEEKVREGLRTGEFIETDLGWTEGMSAWRPLSELESFRTPPSAPVTESETATVAPGSEILTSPVMPAAGARSGLPWDNREQLGWFNALLETIQEVLLRPTEAFTRMQREGGLVNPLLYTLILGMVGAVAGFIFSVGFRAIGIGGENGLGALLGAGASSFAILILTPFLIIIFTFIFAGIIHLVLMLLSGANQPFETTLRVVCYASGSASILQLIPLCGSLIASVYSLVLNSIGLARAHETDTWRGVVAVLSPVLLCCGGGIFFVVMIGGLAALGANWG